MGLGALSEMSEPVRILQVLGRLDRGGAETMIMNLYRRMDRDRIQFDFVIHTEDVCEYSEEVLSLGGRIYSMRPFRGAGVIGYRRQWRTFFAKHPEIAIVHGHMRSTASIYLAEAKRAGVRTIAHSHNTSSGKGIHAFVKNMLQRSIADHADRLLACSLGSGEWLYGPEKCVEPRFAVLPNGIDCTRFTFDPADRDATRKALSVSQEQIVILHIGRMEAQKNQAFLLRIAAHLMERDGKLPGGVPKYIFLLCGEGPLEMQLKEQAAKLELSDAVRFLGVRDDIPHLMDAADLMVFPSLFEGLPVTLVEAQASGLPVVMSDTITDEVVMTDLVTTAPMPGSVTDWLTAIDAVRKRLEESQGSPDSEGACNDRDAARQAYAGQIKAHGYDVADTAKWLTDFYLGL
ncbi:MAG: glycosyltransferase family 1 protein [Lachnospiraceae bacterium]|nr:glycosyltransferase family 1 protein [Lachnospiraceae bacterium]